MRCFLRPRTPDRTASPRTAASEAGHRRSAGSSDGRCGPASISPLWARTRSRSIAMCCRPMAVPAPRRSPAPTSHWPMRSRTSRRWASCRTHGRFRAVSPPAGRLSSRIAAVSVGVVDGRVRVDLPYEEDSRAEVDMNVVATDTGTLVEIQGTGEGATFPRSTLDKLLDMALGACDTVFAVQREALELPYPGVLPEGPAGSKAFGS